MPSRRPSGSGGDSAYGLGPPTNTFANDAARDAYATANAAWLADYNANRFFWIRNGTKIQRRNASGTSWEDVTPVVQGRTGGRGADGSFELSIFRSYTGNLPATPTTPSSVGAGNNPTLPNGWSATPPDTTDPIAIVKQRVARGATAVTYTPPRRWDGRDGVGEGTGNLPSAGAQDIGRLLRVGSDEAPFWDEVEDILEGRVPDTYGLSREDVSLVKHIPATHRYADSTTVRVYFATQHTFDGLDSAAKYSALAWQAVGTETNLRTGGRFLVRVPLADIATESVTRGRILHTTTTDLHVPVGFTFADLTERFRNSQYAFYSTGFFAVFTDQGMGFDHTFKWQDYGIEVAIDTVHLDDDAVNRLLPTPTAGSKDKFIKVNAAGDAWELVNGPAFYPPATVATGAARLPLQNGETSLDVVLGAVTSASGFLSVSGNELVLRRGIYRITSSFTHYAASSGVTEYNNNNQTRFDVMMEASGTGIIQAEEGGYTRPIGGQSYGHHSVGVTIYIPANDTGVELGLVGHAQANSGAVGLDNIIVWPVSVP